MAPGKTEKKRKAVTATAPTGPVPPSKKSKRSEEKPSKLPTESTASPAQKKAVVASEDKGVVASKPLKINGDAARKIKPRKRAADFLSDDENDNVKGAKLSEVKNPSVADKSKSSKKKPKKEVVADTTAVSAPAPTTAGDDVKSQKGKNNKDKKEGKATKKPETVAEPASDVPEDVEQGESEGEGEDDQTVALIKGFESSGDEDISGDEGFEQGKPVPTIPDSKKTKRKLQKLAKKRDTPDEPGAVYVGRIPHGFYEKEMRAYFSQFGPITRLRLSRNRVTGRSKHYAFIEFASTSVAKVVADTMDNYLMFGHILKCKFAPPENLHPEVWKGANRRFNRTPWNRVEQFRLEGGKTREKWSKSVSVEQGKRASKAEKMKALGYELKLPTLKGVEEVPVQVRPAKLKEGAEETGDGAEVEAEAEKVDETKAIDAAKAVDTEKETTGKSRKKAKKNKEATKSDENGEQIKELEVDDSPKSEKKKRVADADVTSTSKKAKKATKDADATTPVKSSRKSRRESAGDEAKPVKAEKGDKTKAKA